jgi:hypothetical protein
VENTEIAAPTFLNVAEVTASGKTLADFPGLINFSNGKNE